MSQPPCKTSQIDFGAMRARMVQEFSNADLDKDATLSRDEFREWLKRWEITDCDYLFDLADQDGNGQVDIREFLAFFQAMLQKATTKDMTGFVQLAFTTADKDKRGHLTLLEFRKFLTYLGESLTLDEQNRVFRAIDADKNGSISLPEILANYQMIFDMVDRH